LLKLPDGSAQGPFFLELPSESVKGVASDRENGRLRTLQ
jgi:hypothetical protein